MSDTPAADTVLDEETLGWLERRNEAARAAGNGFVIVPIECAEALVAVARRVVPTADESR